MRLLIATDAWAPQINGVVRTLQNLAIEAARLGIDVGFLTPDAFRSLPLPTYPGIRLALATPGRAALLLRRFDPTHVHIATEGPVGHAARRRCLNDGRPFTTSYHTKFPEYLAARAPVPLDWSYAWLRRFHNAGRGTMVSSASLEQDLAVRGFRRLLRWGRGVDTSLFRPRPRSALDLPRPIFLSVGRLAVEKNLAAFLNLALPGTKVVVGEGPARRQLEKIDPSAVFLGALEGEALAEVYASADVFVFPSRTDTFGIVLLEALASGLPIAALPVTGPLDILAGTGCGALSWDLQEAALMALEIPRDRCRDYGARFTWQESARQFFDNVRGATRRDGAPACVGQVTTRPGLA